MQLIQKKTQQTCTFILPNSDPCIHEEVRPKLSVLGGAKMRQTPIPHTGGSVG